MEDEHRRKTSNRYSPAAAFIHSAALVLPYLNPTELASISSTCKTFYQISKHITSRRTMDASRGLENLPIPFLNSISGDTQPYSFFHYTPSQTLPVRSDFRQPWGSDHDSRLCKEEDWPDPFLFRVDGAFGCECASCSGDCCPCSEAGGDFFRSRECGPSCKCDSGCGNRMTQRGVTVGLKIVKDERKGWGLYAAEFIPMGQFVCEYAGEVLCTKEARERQQRYDKVASSSPALLVVKEHLPSGNTCMRINIDATTMGNIARFVNHSCDGGNLETVLVRSNGALLPRACFFSSRDIQENEELTFSYGEVDTTTAHHPCFCEAASCVGILPSEHT